ncbi:MAG: hypothetical protein U0U25_04490 [Flavobacteriales bacterium]
MSTGVRTALVVTLLLLGTVSSAQSKKDIIAAQSSAMDSMERVMDQQHVMILKATEVIGLYKDSLEARDKALVVMRQRCDSLRTVCMKVSREKDDLVNQRRICAGKLQRTGTSTQRYICSTPFSISGLSDTLSLEFAGPDLLSSVITFRIISWKGDELYRAPIELLRPEELTADPALQRCAQETRILAFFQDRRFSFPPIDAQRDAEHSENIAAGVSYAVDRSTWDAIRFDAYTSSFTFPVDARASRTIAYSRKLSKVVELGPAE